MDKDIKIIIEMTSDTEHAEISVSGMTSEQVSFITPRLLKLMDEMKNQKIAQY